ncbi:MAG: hypothetical protein AB8H79_13560 [Myxococcota bacterium]
MSRWLPWLALVLAACAGESAQDLLDRSAARPTAPRLQARFRATMTGPHPTLSGAVQGGVLIERPVGARLDLQGFGGATVASSVLAHDGLSVSLPARRQHLVSPWAAKALGAASGGDLKTDDLLALWVGRLPLEGRALLASHSGPEGVAVVLSGPSGTQLRAELSRDCACPSAAEVVDAQGRPLVSIRYESWTEAHGLPLPDELWVRAPIGGTELRVSVTAWERADRALQPNLAAPDGFEQQPLQPALDRLARRATRELRRTRSRTAPR